MALKLVLDTDVKFSKRKDRIICKLCGTNKTRKLSNGGPIWIKDKNIRREWNGQYICYDCFYTQKRICHKCCLEDTRDSRSCRIHRYYEGDIWTGKYICEDCYKKEYEYSRNKNMDKNIMLKLGAGRGSLMDIVVSRVLDVPTYSIYMGDMRLPFNIIHEYYGIIGIKISKLRYNTWHFNINERISADSYFCIGLDENLKNIEIVYIFPAKRKKRNQIDIHKNNLNYKEFRVDADPYNKEFKELSKGTLITKNE